jgi:hypothetical protein
MAPQRPVGTHVEGAALLTFGMAMLVLLVLTLAGELRWAGMLAWLVAYGPHAALVLLALACLLAGWRAFRQPAVDQPEPRPPLRPIRWWMVAAAIVLVVVATWVGLNLMLTLTASADSLVRLDAIKTGLAIGAAGAAAVALVFTARRQWLGERTQVHAETDAAERRVTELYHKAADQFGTDKDPLVRLAGLYALERLAQQHPEHRRAIVNVICAYLRIPYSSAAARNHAPSPRPRRDMQVHLAAQAIIAEHLRPTLDRRTNPKFWSDIDLDLTGATLTDLDLGDCHIRTARFTDARFLGSTTFIGAHFAKQASFRDTRFTGQVEFRNVFFADDADFTRARFAAEGIFPATRFAAAARFPHVHFAGDARFLDAEFDGDVDFAGARFAGIAEFVNARFVADQSIVTRLRQAHHASTPQLAGATFGQRRRPGTLPELMNKITGRLARLGKR